MKLEEHPFYGISRDNFSDQANYPKFHIVFQVKQMEALKSNHRRVSLNKNWKENIYRGVYAFKTSSSIGSLIRNLWQRSRILDFAKPQKD